MKGVFARLGSPDAINWISVVALIPLQTAGSFILSTVDFQSRVPEFLLVRGISLILEFGILGVAKWMLTTNIPQRVKPYITLTSFVLSVFLGTAAFDYLLVAAGFEQESRLWTRFLLTGVGLITTLIVIAAVVAYLREFSTSNRALGQAVEALIETRGQASARITARHAQLLERIDTQVTREIEPLNAAATHVSPTQMKSLLDDVVRPLSYQLEREIVDDETTVTVIPSSRIQWLQVLHRLLMTVPFHPLTNSAWIAAIVGSFLIPNYGLIGVLSAVEVFVIYYVLGYVAGGSWRLLPQRVGVGIRAVLAFSTYAVIALIAGVGVSYLGAFSVLQPDRLVSWLVVSVIFSFMLSLLYTAVELMRETGVALQSALDDLKREVVALNTAYWQLQRGISRALHGPVQQAISASIYRLQSTPEAASDPKVLAEVKLRISQSLEQLRGTRTATVQLRDTFAQLTELWADVSPITVTVTDAHLDAIQEDAGAALAVHELVTEACGNAMKHGAAKHMIVSLTVDADAHLINLSVVNDGTPLATEVVPGMGTQLLDEMCLSWSRTQERDLVQLEAVVPLSAG